MGNLLGVGEGGKELRSVHFVTMIIKGDFFLM